MQPDMAKVEAYRTRARALWEAQRAEEVEAVAREGLARFPDQEELRTLLAHALLLQGRYLEGFRENERRPPRLKAPTWQLPFPEWDGPIAGRSILVWGEQGIGDEIMMARFVPALRELGASRVTLACWPAAVAAFEQLGADRVIGRYGKLEVEGHDCWISAFSLPYRLGLRLEYLSGEPYLAASPDGPGGVGLVERGRPDHPFDADRSIPEGMLQAAIPQGRLLTPGDDVQGSLAKVAALDLLVTVDTSWAHMAGALGVPCWLLLPHRGLDWRWMRERPDSPWYRSMRLFRQPSRGDWAAVLANVQTELRGR